MLLQALVEHAATREDIPPVFYRTKRISWQIIVSRDGKPGHARLHDLRPPKGESGHMSEAPYMYRSGQAAPAYLLCDNAQYVLGVWRTKPAVDGEVEEIDAKAEAKARWCQEQFIALARAWIAGAPEDPTAVAVAALLESEALSALVVPPDVLKNDTVAISIDGAWAHTARSAQRFWRGVVSQAKSAGGVTGVCLSCGEPGVLLATIPESVKAGSIPSTGQTKDAQLVSINTAAQGRGGLIQLGNTPVCEGCGAAGMAGLNALLADPHHRKRTKDSVLIWWTRSAEELDFDALADAADPKEVSDLLAQSGKPDAYSRAGMAGVGLDPDRFYALTLSLNNARVMVRDWIDVPVADAKDHVRSWFTDHELVHGWEQRTGIFPLWRLTQAAARFDKGKNKYIAETVPHGLERDLWLSFFKGSPPPAYLLPHLLQRIRSDHRLDGPRAALLRLILTRSPLTRGKAITMPGLDPDADDAGYLCGRLFALYESIQHLALRNPDGKGPNASIVDKYFATAMTAPLGVFNTLAKNVPNHLKRIARSAPGAAVNLEKDLTALNALFGAGGSAIPRLLNAEQQSRFNIGYYHQRQAGFQAAAEKKAEKDLTAATSA